jgi:hypothetical protein
MVAFQAAFWGTGEGQPVAEGMSPRPTTAPGGDASGGLLDPAFLGGDSQSVEFDAVALMSFSRSVLSTSANPGPIALERFPAQGPRFSGSHR